MSHGKVVGMQTRFSRTPGGWYAAPGSVVVGDVRIGEQSSVWFGAVIRGDVAPVIIGKRVNIQDGSVVHCDSGIDNVIEDDVTIGHRAVVHGEFVGQGTLIGMGAIVLGKSRIGRGCLIAAGALVSPGTIVPDGMVVMGVPGKIVRPLKPSEIDYRNWLSGHYVELARKYAESGFIDCAAT